MDFHVVEKLLKCHKFVYILVGSDHCYMHSAWSYVSTSLWRGYKRAQVQVRLGSESVCGLLLLPAYFVFDKIRLRKVADQLTSRQCCEII